MFKRHELSDRDVVDLAEFATDQGVAFHSTPANADSVLLLREGSVGVLKSGSVLGNLILIQAMGETGLPVVLSTGMVEAEISAAVDAFASTENQNLVLLHCLSKYPNPDAELNLRRMQSLRERFACMVGFSDHSDAP